MNISAKQDGTAVTRKSSTTSLPASLINTYFHLFEMTVKKEEVNSKKMSDKKKSNNNITKKDSASSSGTMKSRILGALLTGVNRAHPYLPKKDAAMEQHIDSLYRPMVEPCCYSSLPWDRSNRTQQPLLPATISRVIAQ